MDSTAAVSPVSRVLFRSLLRGLRSYVKEVERGGSVIKENEESKMFSKFPVRNSFKPTRSFPIKYYKDIIRSEFAFNRNLSGDMQKNTIYYGFEILKAITERRRHLEKMVYIPESETITNNIKIHAKCSSMVPLNGGWRSDYTITVENLSSDSNIQLLGRYWNFTFSNGTIKDVLGNKLVGKSPILAPGESYSYSSFAALTDGNYFATQSGYLRILEFKKDGDAVKYNANVSPFCLSHVDHNQEDSERKALHAKISEVNAAFAEAISKNINSNITETGNEPPQQDTPEDGGQPNVP